MTTESTREELILRQIWNNKFPHLSHLSWDPLHLGIDESLAEAIAHSLEPMPEEMAAVLDYWRDRMVATIDAIVDNYKSGAAAD